MTSDRHFNHPTGGPNNEFVRTRTGILIGSAAKPRMPQLSRDGEAIQAALLRPRKRTMCERFLHWFL